jgi:hypothetical protein
LTNVSKDISTNPPTARAGAASCSINLGSVLGSRRVLNVRHGEEFVTTCRGGSPSQFLSVALSKPDHSN